MEDWISLLVNVTPLQSIIYWIVFIILWLWIDIDHYLDQDWIENHTSRWILRFLCWIVFSVDSFSLVVNGLLWILLFSPGWGAVVHNDLFYLGTTARYDRVLGKYPILYKLFLALSLFTLIYISYEKITTGTSLVG